MPNGFDPVNEKTACIHGVFAVRFLHEPDAPAALNPVHPCAMKIFCLWLAIASTALPAEVLRIEINRAYVEDAAKKLAAKPYAPRKNSLPDFLRDMTYDDYSRIRFVPDSSLWRADKLPFQIQFFHPGSLHQVPVGIWEYTGTHVQQIPFVRTFFDYQDLPFAARLPPSLEYAGFRVMHPLMAPDKWDEVISFLGASYFRALGKDHRYGMSARGIAINCGGPGQEEFPDFVMFWLGKPAKDAKSLTFFGLLDGPSVTGAYQFTLTPGEETLVQVQAKLFFRKDVANLGIAPLTSMFWFGENTASRFGDFRNEVHDSDGLLIAPEGDVRLWRPLTNPTGLRLTDFPAAAPVGFGLLQRDRDFRSYEDVEARYERRPSVWVEPVGQWPVGKVRLLELPTKNEYADNIVAYWSPLESPKAGDTLEFGYRMKWTGAAFFGGPRGWTMATRQTVQVEQRPKRSLFVLDFGSPELEKIPGSAAVTADIGVPKGVKLLHQRVYRNDGDGTWRLGALFDAPDQTGPVELRARLLLEGKPLTETWVGSWEP